ncbi:hypothetical protein [Gymnodinialimonas hymeniacidonis]|uniref:hypothetical protein n=1 Tax=Gymnodinialimonas hymeniacidonis TaxID=3126508 RepID=UPI0034C676FA
MSDTSTNWKRGLLKAWLALSLIWALVLFIWVFWVMEGFSGGLDTISLLIVAIFFYVLPLGVLPCLLVLLIGWIVVSIIDRRSRV